MIRAFLIGAGVTGVLATGVFFAVVKDRTVPVTVVRVYEDPSPPDMQCSTGRHITLMVDQAGYWYERCGQLGKPGERIRIER